MCEREKGGWIWVAFLVLSCVALANHRSPDFQFQAVALQDSVVLRWTNPIEHGYGSAHVEIRYSTDHYPQSLTDGHRLHRGTLPEDKFVHSNLQSGQTYYYSIWTSNDGLTFFEPLPETGQFLVVDLREGPLAPLYPYYFTNAPPSGGWPEEYKTTKLVLRCIRADTFMMGSPETERGRTPYERLHEVTLTNRFFVGVFPTTQRQWERVMGTWPSYFANPLYRDTRPVEQVSYEMIRGERLGAGWPAHSDVDAHSFIGRLRQRTGLPFDLPTEAQWEHAARARTTAALSSGKNLSCIVACNHVTEVARYWSNVRRSFNPQSDSGAGTKPVGFFPPNAWGLHDIHGNVYEWCLDWHDHYAQGPVVEPKGPSSGWGRVQRGGCWSSFAEECRLASRHHANANAISFRTGFRVAMHQGEPPPPSVQVATPTFNPDGGIHPGSHVLVTVDCSTPHAVIRYTINNTTPTEASPVVAAGGTVSVPMPGTLRARAWREGMLRSEIKSALYEAERDFVLPGVGPWANSRSGGSGTTVDVWDISALPDGAMIDMRFDAMNVPDRFVIEYPPGTVVADTGWRGRQSFVDNSPELYPGGWAGPGQGTIDDMLVKDGFGAVRISVYGPASGTAWNYSLRARLP